MLVLDHRLNAELTGNLLLDSCLEPMFDLVASPDERKTEMARASWSFWTQRARSTYLIPTGGSVRSARWAMFVVCRS